MDVLGRGGKEGEEQEVGVNLRKDKKGGRKREGLTDTNDGAIGGDEEGVEGGVRRGTLEPDLDLELTGIQGFRGRCWSGQGSREEEAEGRGDGGVLHCDAENWKRGLMKVNLEGGLEGQEFCGLV